MDQSKNKDIGFFEHPINSTSSCPMRMSDGRHFTNYNTQCTTNYVVKQTHGIKSSFDYRNFLTRNATGFMQGDRENAYLKHKSHRCVGNVAVGTAVPERQRVVCSKLSCDTYTINPKGIGTGVQNYDAPNQGLLNEIQAYTGQQLFYPVGGLVDQVKSKNQHPKPVLRK